MNQGKALTRKVSTLAAKRHRVSVPKAMARQLLCAKRRSLTTEDEWSKILQKYTLLESSAHKACLFPKVNHLATLVSQTSKTWDEIIDEQQAILRQFNCYLAACAPNKLPSE